MKHFFLKFFIIFSWILLIFGMLLIPKIDLKKSYNDRSIDVFVWGDYFESKTIKKFEELNNIKVNLHYYSSNEEMMLKLRAHKGSGYDLVVPSDYAVQILIKENLLQPMDYSKINFLHKISPILLDHNFDPKNKYSLPNMWEVYGIGYDSEQLKEIDLKPTLGHFFDKNLISYKFSMTPDPVEAIVFASCYLYGRINQLSAQQALEVKNLLIEQKPFVEAYADYRAKYLMQTKNCPIAVIRSSLLFYIAQENPHMQFVIPDEATITTIENVAIPVGCKKQEMVYKFLNFIYEDEPHASQLDICPLFPAVKSSLDYTDEVKEFYDTYEKAIKKDNLYFFRYLIPEEEIRDMWVEIKN